MGLGDQFEKGQELDVGVTRVAGVSGDLAGGDLQRGEQAGRAVADVIMGLFITDGGHWDNLGLVELLRRRCDEIYCIDASADPPHSFDALRQAIALASLELEECHNLDPNFTRLLGDLRPRKEDDVLPRTNVTTFRLDLSGCSPPSGNG